MSVVLEDDGSVAYAYLLKNETVVGDVWLYNVAPAPSNIDWNDHSAMPFLNPREYCGTIAIPRMKEDSKLSYDWFAKGVKIWIDGVYSARLEIGLKPGWSRSAAQGGPLANPLTDSV